MTATTLGGAFNLFVPGWNFSPTVGVGYAAITVTISGTTETLSQSVGGFAASDSHTYVIAGIDWVTSGGFNLGAGVNISMKEGVGQLSFLNIGWFF